MKLRLQQVGIVLMAISTGFVTGGCAGGKVSQCANMIKVVNQTVIDTKTITAAGSNGDVVTIDKMAEMLDKAAKDLEAVSISDEKLKKYKGQFVAMYQGGSQVNRQLVVSLKAKKRTEVDQGLRKSGDIFSPEKDLATGLTQYCKEPEK